MALYVQDMVTSVLKEKNKIFYHWNILNLKIFLIQNEYFY